eukprot:100855_1
MMTIAKTKKLNANNVSKNKKKKRKQKSIQNAVKDQLQELISTFELLVDDIPIKNMKNEATKIKTKVDEQRKKLMSLIKKRQNMVSQKLNKNHYHFVLECKNQSEPQSLGIQIDRYVVIFRN